MITVGLVGAGAISRSHIEAYLQFPERCRVIAISDIYPDKATEKINGYSLDAQAFDSHVALLQARHPDLVSVCTPPSKHAEVACDVLRSGASALVEKPMSASLSECDEILAAAEHGGGRLSVVAQNRFSNPMSKLKRLLASKAAGDILHVQVDSHWWRGASYYDLWWRGTWEQEGGGCTLNHAVHHIDALVWMMGMPGQLQATMTNIAHDNSEVEDLCMVHMRFPNGAAGQLTASLVHHGEEQQIVFQCRRARISMPWHVRASRSMTNGFPERDEQTEAEIQGLYESLATLEHEGHAGQVDDMLSALEQGRPPSVSGVDGRRALELITAIYKSAITGAVVDLPLDPSDRYYNRGELMASAPRFHEKVRSVERAADETITLGSGSPVGPPH
ncbi:MAG TPA: Gfo/Idh/MocA family oxidoreductase [Acidimicrobiales bacterium]|nr:Gfo/Idh/MocA family oxidoreductase [Acidimicrobiales bacterium]